MPHRCLLAAVTIAALGCGKGPEVPHGAPVLLEVLWELKGVPTRVWSRDADAAVAAVVPPQGTRVDFVFDRRLDGARVEDTVDGMEVPKANPPISAGWPDSDTVMSDPPFAAAVLYNSLPDWGPETTYAFLTPRPAGFPAATAVTFTLDPNGLTSVYGEPMDGPTAITVNTGPFTVVAAEQQRNGADQLPGADGVLDARAARPDAETVHSRPRGRHAVAVRSQERQRGHDADLHHPDPDRLQRLAGQHRDHHLRGPGPAGRVRQAARDAGGGPLRDVIHRRLRRHRRGRERRGRWPTRARTQRTRTTRRDDGGTTDGGATDGGADDGPPDDAPQSN